MPNSYFQFKHFIVHQNKCAMKVCTDSCLFGAWVAKQIPLNTNTIIDIGTGTGLLSLMLHQQLPLATIMGIDVDDNAVEQATQNCINFPAIKIQKQDVLQLAENNKFDVIICNPPFYENQLKSPSNIKNLAYHAENLTHYNLIEKMAKLLSEKGCIYILLPFFNYENLLSICSKNNLHLQKLALVKQTNKHNYFRAMMQLGFSEPAEIVKEFINIKEENSTYSKDFSFYLKPYYLNL